MVAPGRWRLRVSLDHASHYEHDGNAREAITLDGESTRLGLDLRRGLGGCWEVGATVPLLAQYGGHLDRLIDAYHNLFGFPQGGRDRAPRDRLLLHYVKDGQTRLRMGRSGAGLGDVSLSAGRQVWGAHRDASRLVLRAAVKAPTGSSRDLRGSGGWDLAVWLTGDRRWPCRGGRVTLLAAAGVLGMTEGHVLEDQQRHRAEFGSLALGWAPGRRWALQVQANGHTALYRASRLRELSMASVQLTTSGCVALAARTDVEAGFTEDVVVKTSPDIVFHLAVRQTF